MKSFSIITFCVAIVLIVFLSFHYRQGIAAVPPSSSYTELAGKLVVAVKEQGVDQAFDLLQIELTKKPALWKYCHALTHEIGYASYERFGFQKAIVMERDECGSGYVHGVIERRFKNVQDLIPLAQTLCTSGKIDCFHGIGHGLMLATDNNLPQSIVVCNTLQGVRERMQCYGGVFMENFDGDDASHPTQFLHADDPFYPCNEQSVESRSVCAVYAPRFYLKLHTGEYQNAMRWCENLDADVVQSCEEGLGAVIMKEHLLTPLSADNICDTFTLDQKTNCLSGMISYFIVDHASAKQGAGLCPSLQADDRSTCEATVQSHQAFYPN